MIDFVTSKNLIDRHLLLAISLAWLAERERERERESVGSSSERQAAAAADQASEISAAAADMKQASRLDDEGKTKCKTKAKRILIILF